MQALRLLGMALATLRVTETAKEISPLIPPPAVKSTFTVALGIGMSVLMGERDPVRVLVEGTAVAGAASVLHDFQDSMKRFTDNQISGVLQRVPRRAGPLGS